MLSPAPGFWDFEIKNARNLISATAPSQTLLSDAVQTPHLATEWHAPTHEPIHFRSTTQVSQIFEPYHFWPMCSGNGTNLKVGGGHMSHCPARSAPPTFVDFTSTVVVVFGERFRDGQYSLVSFLLAVLLLTVPHACPAICKTGEHVPPVSYGVGATGNAPTPLIYPLASVNPELYHFLKRLPPTFPPSVQFNAELGP